MAFEVFLRRNGIRHSRCTPYHPASNGEAERFVRTFKEAMKASGRDGLPLPHRLQSFLLTYRATPHATTGRAPCELFLGRKVRTRLDLLRPSVEDHVLQQQNQQKANHDRHARHREFEVGQKVMVKGRRPGSAAWVTGRIMAKSGPVTFVVDMGEGKEWRCHVDQLKYCLDTEGSNDTAAGFEFSPADDESDKCDTEVATSNDDTLVSVPDMQEASPLSELHSGESVDEPISLPAEGSMSNSETESHVATPATGVSHKYPLRDREKHRRFKL